MTVKSDLIKNADQFVDAVAELIASGIYDENSLRTLIKPLGEAQLAAGRFTDDMGEQLDVLRTELDDPETSNSRRRDILVDLLEVLSGRKILKRRECISDLSNVLGPNNAKSWREFQNDRRAMDAKIATGDVDPEIARRAKASVREIEAIYEEKAAKVRQLSELEVSVKTEREAGRMSPQRAARLDTLFPELRTHLDTPIDADAATLAAADMRLRELLEIVTRTMSDSSGACEFPSGSRAAAVSHFLVELKAAAVTEITASGISAAERAALDRAGVVVVQSSSTLDANASDTDVIELERETIRETAIELKDFHLREHVMLIEPAWPTPRVERRDPNAVAYVGGPAARPAVEAACTQRGLALGPPNKRGVDPALFRWETLWAAHVAVFDLSVPLGSPQLAATCYELGIALALGRPVVVLSRAGQTPPFDVDLEPVVISGDASDVEAIGEAIDLALYLPQRRALASSVGTTVEFATANVPGYLGANDPAPTDPLTTRRLVRDAIARARSTRQLVCLPPWPASYPDPKSPRCFHVMAFRAALDWTVTAVSRACKSAGITYVRGDRVLEPNIVMSIWQELCIATHVVVDITTLNANVFLELGMAHTIGRNVFVIGRDPASISAIPTLAKTRVHGYDEQSLAGVLARLFETR